MSLIASATEIVHALDLTEYQVGRSHECDHPARILPLPICTKPLIDAGADAREIDRQVKSQMARAESVYEVHADIMARLRPTHILTQTQCKVCAVSREDVERAMSRRFLGDPLVVSLEPNGVNDIWHDIRRVADACGVTRRGEELVVALYQSMKEIAQRARAAGGRPRTVLIEWPEPLMAAGNWMPELVEMAGGMNLFGTAGHHSPWLNWAQLAQADPEVMVVAPCGFDMKRTRTEMHWLTTRPEWPRLRAVQEGRVFLADGNLYFNRPGPRVVEALRALAEILHPEAFPASLKGAAWEPWEPV